MKYEYCPNWNHWIDVSWWMDTKEYLFCDCNKCKWQVYELRPINVTKKIPLDKISGFYRRIKCDEIKRKINTKNMLDIEGLLDKK